MIIRLPQIQWTQYASMSTLVLFPHKYQRVARKPYILYGISSTRRRLHAVRLSDGIYSIELCDLCNVCRVRGRRPDQCQVQYF